MPTFKSEGTEIYYQEEGEGFPLVLLHGLTSNSEMFRHEIDQFKEKYRVIAPDARGHGNSDKPEQYELKDHIWDVVSLVDHLGLDSFHLIGVSMGSYIAQGVAIELGDRVKKLVLVATKSHGEQASMEELYERHADEMAGMTAIDKMMAASKYMFHNQKAVGKWLHETAENSEQLTLHEQAIASKALEGFDFRKDLHRIRAEALVIGGLHDGLNPPEYGEETAQLIPAGVFLEFKLSGHAPNVEQPRLFIEVVSNFLE
ncbi:alpha/beta hydrolase [Sporosarcina luteola]|uniref:alpha/beta fold hydrolase n=1 Tax=Sporosarcina luteola TaxID=582850 RepID=UPI00203CC7C1|nr:alpha/beta fold hydrolase [Sporosarcina luteola]MCM3636422.1 alpha/beta hydrolase [Sporosarcina luteola]